MTQMCLGATLNGQWVAAPRARTYDSAMTADVNRKGVLDIDTVKGCTAGMAAHPDGGCYGACYAHNTAKFMGLDFSRSIVRHIHNGTHAAMIETAVRHAPYGFFRVGTMGDPSHAWEHTVRVIEWLAPHGVPVIVTKHWQRATDSQFKRLVDCGAILNTSVSALDTPAQLAHREREIARYDGLGGVSVARIVSCDFNPEHPEGAGMADTQDRLFGLTPVIDNPLRVSRNHALVESGVIRVHPMVDLTATRTVSVARPGAYVGHCGPCPDRCGLAFVRDDHPRPKPLQLSMFKEAA